MNLNQANTLPSRTKEKGVPHRMMLKMALTGRATRFMGFQFLWTTTLLLEGPTPLLHICGSLTQPAQIDVICMER